jgi:large conductance mechanosensitive channel
VNKVKEAAAKEEKEAPEEPKGPTELEVLLEIRDSLKK